ncbi:hypothetical protein Tco_1050063 [Tanacetum coccineum]
MVNSHVSQKDKEYPEEGQDQKSDLEGLAFELLKNIFKNSVELEYNLEQFYIETINKVDWTNPEGNRFHDDLRKPLSLEGPPGRKTILIRYFFNKDLEYPMHGNKERKYALSLQRDAELGIHHWRDNCQWFYKGNIGRPSSHDVYSKVKIISVQMISVDKWYGHGYLKEIVVKRAD